MKYNKPIVIAGNGIRLSNTVNKFKEFIETYQIPFVTSYLGKDLLPTDHPLNIGVMGIKGNKAANMATQNADLIINLGSRLSTGQIGYDGEFINKDAKLIIVDISNEEFKARFFKYKYFNSIKDFLNLVLYNIIIQPFNWIKQCQQWKEEFKIVPKQSDFIDIYSFITRLSEIMDDDDVVVSDAGSSYFACAQALNLRGTQRWITSGAQADMGFALPASIGVCIARGKKRVICITGDGSFMLNMQELQTIRRYKLPIKIFILNNRGYVTINNTTKNYFNYTYDYMNPELNFELIAKAFTSGYQKITTLDNFSKLFNNINNNVIWNICDIICNPGQIIIS